MKILRSLFYWRVTSKRTRKQVQTPILTKGGEVEILQIEDFQQKQGKQKGAFWRKLPRQVDLESLIKFVYSAQKANYRVKDAEFLLDYVSSNLLRIGKKLGNSRKTSFFENVVRLGQLPKNRTVRGRFGNCRQFAEFREFEILFQ